MKRPTTVAVLDACVLYPPSLRDLLMWVAVGGLYAPRWTAQIHDEWTRNVLADRPNVAPIQVERTRRRMDEVLPEGLVFGYEARIPALRLPDADDRHVLAAAIHGGASEIVTFNLADFPAAVLGAHGVQAAHPDIFLSVLLDEQPGLFLRAARTHRASLRRPPKDAAAYLQTLRANGLHALAQRLETNVDRI